MREERKGNICTLLSKRVVWVFFFCFSKSVLFFLVNFHPPPPFQECVCASCFLFLICSCLCLGDRISVQSVPETPHGLRRLQERENFPKGDGLPHTSARVAVDLIGCESVSLAEGLSKSYSIKPALKG